MIRKKKTLGTARWRGWRGPLIPSVLLVVPVLLAGCGGGDKEEQAVVEKPHSMVPANLDTLIRETGVDTMAAGADAVVAAPEMTEIPEAPASEGDPTVAPAAPAPEDRPVTGTGPAPAAPAAVPRSSAAGGGAYSLQLGSFRRLANAEQLADRVRELGYPARLEEAEVGGLTYHRVFIRGLDSRVAAESLGEELHSGLGIDYLVRRSP